MPSHARTVTRTTHRVRNALLVVLLLLVVCAAAAGFSGFKLYKSAMSAKAHLNNVVNAAKVIKDGSTDDMVKALSDVSYIQKERPPPSRMSAAVCGRWRRRCPWSAVT